MEKRIYEKPTMQIVELHHTQMLQMSSGGANIKRRSYGVANAGVDTKQEKVTDEGIWQWY